MTGYQEVLTDPSYAADDLHDVSHAGQLRRSGRGRRISRLGARADHALACPEPSHHSSEASLDEYLSDGGAGYQDIDTRALTRHLRTHGALRAVLSHESRRPGAARLEELARPRGM